jgi:hypothetical protein
MHIKSINPDMYSHFLEGPFSTGLAGSFLGGSTFGGSNGTPLLATLYLSFKPNSSLTCGIISSLVALFVFKTLISSPKYTKI